MTEKEVNWEGITKEVICYTCIFKVNWCTWSYVKPVSQIEKCFIKKWVYSIFTIVILHKLDAATNALTIPFITNKAD